MPRASPPPRRHTSRPPRRAPITTEKSRRTTDNRGQTGQQTTTLTGALATRAPISALAAPTWRQTTTLTSPSRQPKPRAPPVTAPTGDKQPPRRHLLATRSPEPRRHGPGLATQPPDVTFSPTRAPSRDAPPNDKPTVPGPQPEPRPPPSRRPLATNDHPDVTFSPPGAQSPAVTAPDWRQTTTPTSPSRHPEPKTWRHDPHQATNNHPDVTFSPHPEPDRHGRVATGADRGLPAAEPAATSLPVPMLGAGQLREFASPSNVESQPMRLRPLLLITTIAVTLSALFVAVSGIHVGTAATASPNDPFPAGVSANHRYLVDQFGQPYLIVGDSPHSLFVNTSPADAEFYLADRQAHGINAIWVQALCNTYTGGRDDGSTFDGIVPFTTPNDFSTPNPAYWGVFTPSSKRPRTTASPPSWIRSTWPAGTHRWPATGSQGPGLRRLPRQPVQELPEHRVAERQRLPELGGPGRRRQRPGSGARASPPPTRPTSRPSSYRPPHHDNNHRSPNHHDDHASGCRPRRDDPAPAHGAGAGEPGLLVDGI